MSFNRASIYHSGVIAELKSTKGTDLGIEEFLTLIDQPVAYTKEVLRLSRERNPDLSMLIAICSHFAVGQTELGDPLVDRELRRRRCATYGWCLHEMRAWFRKRLRQEAKEAYALGEWFSGIGRLRRRLGIYRCLALLAWAGVRLRAGMIFDIDDVGRDLVELAAAYVA